MGAKAKLSGGLSDRAEGLIELLRRVRQCSDLDFEQIELLLEVVQRPGRTVGEVAKTLERDLSSVSYSLRNLARHRRGGGRGLDLLRLVQDVRDARRKAVEPTAQGRRVATQILEALEGII